MKVPCPKCHQMITLLDLDKTDDRMGQCGKCKINIHATHEKKDGREVWDIHYEKFIKKEPPKRDPFGDFLSRLGYILIAILIIAVLLSYCGQPK